jgi:transposase-like protein
MKKLKQVYPQSIIAFMDTFNTDEKCLNYIASLKWSKGWRCSHCGHNEYNYIKTRGLLQCKNCNYQESFIANTVMRNTRKPLRYWFWAIYMVATQKTGLSAMELYRQLGLNSYQTAWTWLHKIRMAMVNPDRTQLRGMVEVDETYVQTGQAGRGRALGGKKAIVVCAVEIKDTKRAGKVASGRIRLRYIPNVSAKYLHSFVLEHIEKGSIVRTDGLRGYSGLSQYGFKHIVKPTLIPEEASKEFPRVHRVFANLKAWMIGTHRFVSLKHIQNYLNEHMFRFNRRMNPRLAFNTLLRIAVLSKPKIYRRFVKPKRVYYINP